ncbi:hypothetical protein B0I35DRAFT_452584 [Stachybotrys elegans]|uniref:Uncharacterized protein n=1 Tax=Stachybotrys elegans TaxID=80388 RepID=A0A8K0WNX7_9HYPO|nr:hypothetical protein B0I35DRAFT_452584 [Stachybotrys elegans]
MSLNFIQKVTTLPRVVVVTGAASGIGLATARSLAKLGCAVSLADLDLKKLDVAASTIKAETPEARILTTALDIRDRPGVARWIADTETKLGKISGSFNAAGVANAAHTLKPLTETADEEWDLAIGVNLTGTMNCVKEQVRAMKASGSEGSIVVVASIAGLIGTENGSAYTAAKFGTVGLIRSVARETARLGIRVTGIAPATVMTPMTKDSFENGHFLKQVLAATPAGRLAEPEEVADLGIFLLSGASSYISGSTHTLDGALLA